MATAAAGDGAMTAVAVTGTTAAAVTGATAATVTVMTDAVVIGTIAVEATGTTAVAATGASAAPAEIDTTKTTAATVSRMIAMIPVMHARAGIGATTAATLPLNPARSARRMRQKGPTPTQLPKSSMPTRLQP